MASSDSNQGLQIALIAFVMLTIILGVTSFLFYRNYTEADLKSKQLQESESKAQSAASTAQEEMNQMKDMIGLDPAQPFDQVKTAFDADMQKYGATLPEQNRHYQQALGELTTSFNRVSGELAQERLRVEQLQKSFDESEKAKQTQVAAHQQEASAAQQDLGSEKQKFADERAAKEKYDAEVKQIVDSNAQKATQLQAQKAEMETKLGDQISNLESTTKQQAQTIRDLETTSFEVPNGEVSWVSQDTGRVWINLGRADKLARLITFSVHDQRANTLQGEGKKGSIQVTQIIDEHLAVADILDDTVTDPIVPGDKIYTPLWRQGRSERFALAGLIDIDGDGTDDRALVREMISLAGGKVDAELDPDGKVEGALQLETRYLLKGNVLDSKEFQDSWNTMFNEAQRLGIEVVALPKFLDLVGYKPSGEVLRFGRQQAARAATTDEEFRRRRPPGTEEPSLVNEPSPPAADAPSIVDEARPAAADAPSTVDEAPPPGADVEETFP